jgi:hypothetical protein
VPLATIGKVHAEAISFYFRVVVEASVGGEALSWLRCANPALPAIVARVLAKDLSGYPVGDKC